MSHRNEGTRHEVMCDECCGTGKRDLTYELQTARSTFIFWSVVAALCVCAAFFVAVIDSYNWLFWLVVGGSFAIGFETKAEKSFKVLSYIRKAHHLNKIAITYTKEKNISTRWELAEDGEIVVFEEDSTNSNDRQQFR